MAGGLEKFGAESRAAFAHRTSGAGRGQLSAVDLMRSSKDWTDLKPSFGFEGDISRRCSRAMFYAESCSEYLTCLERILPAWALRKELKSVMLLVGHR